MARRETPASGEAEQTETRTKPGDNGFDPEQSKGFAERIVELHTALESESGRLRGEIKDVYGEAKSAGIPKALLKECITEIRGRDKKKSREKDLESDYPGQLEKLKQALGILESTPLGRAAVERTEDEHSRSQE